MGFGKAGHSGSRSRCSFPATSLGAQCLKGLVATSAWQWCGAAGVISTAIAEHSPPYLTAFQANGDSWHRLEIKARLLPSTTLCLLPCTASLAWH